MKPHRVFGTVYVALSFCVLIATARAQAPATGIVDVTGGYVAGWYTSAAAAVVAVPLFLLAAPPLALMASLDSHP